jgi:Tfp pilus assembly protein PilN
VGLYVLYNGENKDALLEKIEASAGIKPVHLSLDVPCGLSVGLAYRAADNTELNLISRRWYQTLQERLRRRTIMNVAMVLFGLWVMLGGIFTGLWIWQKGVLARYEKTLLAYKTPAHEVLKLKRRMAILNRYMDRSGSALECLREVTSLMPQGVKLTSFTYKKGESMKISGEADRSELVLGFNEKLNSSKMFAHVTAETQTMTPEGKYRFGFNIKLAEEVNK